MKVMNHQGTPYLITRDGLFAIANFHRKAMIHGIACPKEVVDAVIKYYSFKITGDEAYWVENDEMQRLLEAYGIIEVVDVLPYGASTRTDWPDFWDANNKMIYLGDYCIGNNLGKTPTKVTGFKRGWYKSYGIKDCTMPYLVFDNGRHCIRDHDVEKVEPPTGSVP